MLTDKDKEVLTAALEKLDSEQLEQLQGVLTQSKTALEDLNSSFPATQDFLRGRGLTNVRQLDAQGMNELKEYLLKVLESIPKPSA